MREQHLFGIAAVLACLLFGAALEASTQISTVERGTTRPGGQLLDKMRVENQEVCWRKCWGNKQCTHWNFGVRGKYRNGCWLYKASSKAQTKSKPNKCCTSGFVGREPWRPAGEPRTVDRDRRGGGNGDLRFPGGGSSGDCTSLYGQDDC